MIHVERLSKPWLVLVVKCCATLINYSSWVGWKESITELIPDLDMLDTKTVQQP